MYQIKKIKKKKKNIKNNKNFTHRSSSSPYANTKTFDQSLPTNEYTITLFSNESNVMSIHTLWNILGYQYTKGLETPRPSFVVTDHHVISKKPFTRCGIFQASTCNNVILSVYRARQMRKFTVAILATDMISQSPNQTSQSPDFIVIKH